MQVKEGNLRVALPRGVTKRWVAGQFKVGDRGGESANSGAVSTD